MSRVMIPVTTFNKSKPVSTKSKISPKEIIVEVMRFKSILMVNISAKNNDKKKNESWKRFASVREFG